MTKYLLLLIILISCNLQKNKNETIEKKEYMNLVGDISFNPKVDSIFIRCDSFSNQYYGIANGPSYKGEFSALRKEIFDSYKSIEKKGQTGFYTVRFMVNCKGNSGMFRTYSTDLDLKEIKFDDRITEQLLVATKELNDWEIAVYNGEVYDYYQYLTFKIVDSELKEIAP